MIFDEERTFDATVAALTVMPFIVWWALLIRLWFLVWIDIGFAIVLASTVTLDKLRKEKR